MIAIHSISNSFVMLYLLMTDSDQWNEKDLKICFSHIKRTDCNWIDVALENLSDFSDVGTIGRLFIICWKSCSIERRMAGRNNLWKCSTLSLIQSWIRWIWMLLLLCMPHSSRFSSIAHHHLLSSDHLCVVFSLITFCHLY